MLFCGGERCRRRNMIYGERLWMARWRKVEEGILKLEAQTDEQRRRDGLIWGTNHWESLLGFNELWSGLRFGSWRWKEVNRSGELGGVFWKKNRVRQWWLFESNFWRIKKVKRWGWRGGRWLARVLMGREWRGKRLGWCVCLVADVGEGEITGEVKGLPAKIGWAATKMRTYIGAG